MWNCLSCLSLWGTSLHYSPVFTENFSPNYICGWCLRRKKSNNRKLNFISPLRAKTSPKTIDRSIWNIQPISVRRISIAKLTTSANTSTYYPLLDQYSSLSIWSEGEKVPIYLRLLQNFQQACTRIFTRMDEICENYHEFSWSFFSTTKSIVLCLSLFFWKVFSLNWED